MHWNDFLGLPVFIINLDRRYDERYNECVRRVREAGFTDIRRWKAVDALQDDLDTHWAIHGSPKFSKIDDEFCTSYKGKQGCFLSHVGLMKHALDNNISRFIVFEDDVLFHPEWDIYAPLFFESTLTSQPDLVYLGAQIEIPRQDAQAARILSAPCFCTHALLYTNSAGIRRIYESLVNMPGGVRTIDCCLIDYQWWMLQGVGKVFKWVAWDARGLSGAAGVHGQNPGWIKRNCGLVFQDEKYESDVRQWP